MTQKLIVNLKLYQDMYKKVLVKLHEKSRIQSSKKWKSERSILLSLQTIHFEDNIQILNISIVLKSQEEDEDAKKSNIIDLENIDPVLLALDDEERRTAVDMEQFAIQAAADLLHDTAPQRTRLEGDLDHDLEHGIQIWEDSE